MTMLNAMPGAMPQASDKQCNKQCETSIELAMHGRTDGRTNGEVTHVSRTTHLPTRARMYGDDVDSKTTPSTPAAPRDEATPTSEETA